MNDNLVEIMPGTTINMRSGDIEFTPKPTPAEELLYKFVIVGADTIAYMGQHPRGRAYVDDLQKIFDGAVQHVIARQAAGVDFSYLNPERI
jgi:hypothetical protein